MGNSLAAKIFYLKLKSNFKSDIVCHSMGWEALGIFPQSIISHKDADRESRKSQIVIEYAYRFFNSNPQGHVFWIYAANAARFDQAYKDIARRMKLPYIDDPDVDVCEYVSDWLDTKDSGQWLVVLDNADNPDLFFGASKASNQENPTKKPLINY